MAFQIIDDTLDFTGDANAVGKSLFGDLREGKMTYPLILGVERSELVRASLPKIVGAEEGASIPEAVVGEVLGALRGTKAIEDSVALARGLAEQAREHLSKLDEHPARGALEAIASAAVERRW